MQETQVQSPGSGRFPRGGHGNPLQYSCMENPMDRGAWRATVHRVTRSWAWLKRLTCIHVIICYIQFYAFVLKCFCVCIKILLCFQKFFNFSGVYLLIRIWHNLSFLINIYRLLLHTRGFSGGSDGKEFACKAGDPGAIPGSGRSPREGNGNPLQYSCLENPRDRGTCCTTVHGVAESDMTKQLILTLTHMSGCMLYPNDIAPYMFLIPKDLH